jgi:glycerol-3-phosphate acyltransferase PlsY
LFGFLLIAYLIGSIPTAYLLSRWFGAGDIREVGSRNAGATNVTLNVGWLPGFLTLAGDMGKGYLAAAVGSLSSSPLVKYLTPAFAIAGHNWPVWLRFHGGGGLATFVGGCLVLSGWPLPAFGLGLWGLAYILLKDHDRSAVLACALLPVAGILAQEPAQTITFITTSSLAVMLRRLQSIKEKVKRWTRE